MIFYNILCISSMSMWPYVHIDIPVLMLPCAGVHKATCRSDYNINIVTMKHIYRALLIEIKQYECTYLSV